MNEMTRIARSFVLWYSSNHSTCSWPHAKKKSRRCTFGTISRHIRYHNGAHTAPLGNPVCSSLPHSIRPFVLPERRRCVRVCLQHDPACVGVLGEPRGFLQVPQEARPQEGGIFVAWQLEKVLVFLCVCEGLKLLVVYMYDPSTHPRPRPRRVCKKLADSVALWETKNHAITSGVCSFQSVIPGSTTNIARVHREGSGGGIRFEIL